MVPRALEVIASWGLVGRIKKEGPMRIYGPGAFSEGDAPINRVWNYETFVGISSHVNRNWLRRSVEKLARNTQFVYD
jgi:hypothetical protein